jgi:hypothetical protein
MGEGAPSSLVRLAATGFPREGVSALGKGP